jgi:hypothetical protein
MVVVRYSQPLLQLVVAAAPDPLGQRLVILAGLAVVVHTTILLAVLVFRVKETTVEMV